MREKMNYPFYSFDLHFWKPSNDRISLNDVNIRCTYKYGTHKTVLKYIINSLYVFFQDPKFIKYNF